MSRTVKFLVVFALEAGALYLVGFTLPGALAIALATGAGAMLRELLG